MSPLLASSALVALRSSAAMVADFAAGGALCGEGLGDGLDAGKTVLGELDGDGTGRGLVAIDGDLAILDGYVLSGRNRDGSAIHSRREGVSGTHDGRIT